MDRREGHGASPYSSSLPRSSSCVAGLPDSVSVDDALRMAGATGRLQTLQFRADAHRDLHVLVRNARRPVPDAVLLRLRPEPGSAVSDGEVGGRGALVADDERLLEDPAAVSRADRGRADVRVLHVHASADALQPGARREGTRRARRRPQYLALEQEFNAAFEARRQAASRSGRREPDGDARGADDRGDGAADARRHAAGHPTRAPSRSFAKQPEIRLHRRELRLSDVHPHGAADRSRRLVDRRHHHGGHRFDRRGAELARDSDA